MNAVTYYQHPRPEVEAMVPPSVTQVVDVGCGAGNLGRALKAARPGLCVRGVEIMPGPAALASGVLDGVVCGSAASPMPEDWPAPDCLIFADVLEHLVEPLAVLKAWSEVLAPGGRVVISLPNAAHHTALGELMKGHWRYQDEGILDRSHLRFFTRESALELIDQAGLEPIRMERTLNYPFHGLAHRLIRSWVRRKARKEPAGGLRPGLARFFLDFSTFQFLFLAQKKKDVEPAGR